MSWTWFHKLASPPHAYRILGRIAPWFGWVALALILLATWWGLVKAPADYQQGDGFQTRMTLAAVLERRDDQKGAIVQYEKAAALGAKYVADYADDTTAWRARTVYFLAESYYYDGKFNEAEAQYQRAYAHPAASDIAATDKVAERARRRRRVRIRPTIFEAV